MAETSFTASEHWGVPGLKKNTVGKLAPRIVAKVRLDFNIMFMCVFMSLYLLLAVPKKNLLETQSKITFYGKKYI